MKSNMRLQQPSLLITDDDSNFRETLRFVLEPRGYRIILAADGQEALDILAHSDVHLVLLDMHMPRLTGLETLRRVKQMRLRMPCILLSARLDECLIQQARLAEAFSVLSKPVSREQLTTTVELAIRRTYEDFVPEANSEIRQPGPGSEPGQGTPPGQLPPHGRFGPKRP
jgi:two-component system chemotaxis response regulator CheY